MRELSEQQGDQRPCERKESHGQEKGGPFSPGGEVACTLRVLGRHGRAGANLDIGLSEVNLFLITMWDWVTSVHGGNLG